MRTLQRKHLVRPAIGTGLFLLIPLVMTVVDRNKPAGDGWHWGPGDFLAMGALLFGAGVAYEFLSSNLERKAYRVAVGLAIALSVFAIWFELAVDGVSKTLRWLAG